MRLAVPGAALLLLGCTDLAGYGPERRTSLLWAQDAEATSQTGCGAERPPLHADVPRAMTANCDYRGEPLAGSQSFEVIDDQWLACAGCWPPAPELWVSFQFRGRSSGSFFALPFSPLHHQTDKDPEFFNRDAGADVVWGTDRVQLRCYDTGAASNVLPLASGALQTLRYHYVAASGVGELWLGEEKVTIKCPTLLPPSGFWARGNIKEGNGAFYLDEIRVATTEAGLAPVGR